MRSVLVTGGAGFIGSNFIPQFLRNHSDVQVVNLDKLTYAGSLDNLVAVRTHDRHVFVEGDITDRALLEALFQKHKFQGVFHFAAESHVDKSISGPDAFVQTNIVGTFQLLEAARGHWLKGPRQIVDGYERARFLHVSTDEVYGSLGATGAFSETSPYAPNSPYSASKASADHLVRSYFQTYGLNVVTTNCSNNFGPHQHDEKLIPTIVRTALAGVPIPLYGKGTNVRDWLYVEEHCAALEHVFDHGAVGETYNIGSRNELENIALARLVCTLLDELSPRADGKSYAEQIRLVADRPGHDERYAVDPAKLERTLGWKPKHNFLSDLKATVAYYLSRHT